MHKIVYFPENLKKFKVSPVNLGRVRLPLTQDFYYFGLMVLNRFPTYGPQSKKTGFPTMYVSNQPTQLQRLAGILKFSMDYYTFQIGNNKNTDQTVQMHMLVCPFVVCM